VKRLQEAATTVDAKVLNGVPEKAAACTAICLQQMKAASNRHFRSLALIVVFFDSLSYLKVMCIVKNKRLMTCCAMFSAWIVIVNRITENFCEDLVSPCAYLCVCVCVRAVKQFNSVIFALLNLYKDVLFCSSCHETCSIPQELYRQPTNYELHLINVISCVIFLFPF
jgi:hypothetical protein